MHETDGKSTENMTLKKILGKLNCMEFQKIPIERIWKKFEIVSKGFSEILKKF